MRRAARVDENHREIKEALVKAGCTVADTSRSGSGFPDLVVGYRGRNYLIEVKDGRKTPSRRGLNDEQKRFHALWRGQVTVVKTAEEAIKLVTGE